MALWTPPMPVSTLTSEAAVKAGNLRVDEHLSYLYQMSLMEEASWPPVYVKKELLKRTALEAELDGKHKMHHRNNVTGAAAAAANPSAVAGLRYPTPRQQIEAEN